MTITLVIDALLAGLLAATLAACILLERRLKALRDGQDGLKQTIGTLNGALAASSASLAALRSAAREADEALGQRVVRARALTDEMDVLVSTGERVAKRIEVGVIAARAARPAKPSLRVAAGAER